MEKELGLNLAGRRVLVACSGGADSTALLFCLHYLAPRAAFQLCAAHLDHGLRPSSAAEADSCLKLCARLGIAALSERREVAALAASDGLGLEEAARQSRYDFLRAAAGQLGCDLVATGHNLNDLAEDQLMRLIRGTGWPGLAGMRAFDPGRKLVRPLLLHSRRETEAFLEALGQSWIEDESNADQVFFRNRVRARLLPLILEENPSFLETVAGLWQLGRLDESWIESALDRALDRALDKKKAAASGRPQHGAEDKPKDRADIPFQSTGSGFSVTEGSLPPAGSGFSVTEGSFSPAGSGFSADGVPFLPTGELRALAPALRLRLYKRLLDSLGPGQARLKGLLAVEAAFAAQGKATRHQFPGLKEILVDARGISWQKRAGTGVPLQKSWRAKHGDMTIGR